MEELQGKKSCQEALKLVKNSKLCYNFIYNLYKEVILVITVLILILLILIALGNKTAIFILSIVAILLNSIKIRQGFSIRKFDPIEWHKSLIINGGIIFISIVYLITSFI